MDYDERVMALKKAYADIILNTSKEAAARVMMSERKAQRFEHELKVAKEEGLRMMLRIKQMMDAKVSEAESTALNQKRKIDELEAQLHEAEDIVRDLREELREVQSELEMVKRDKAQSREKTDFPTHGQLEMNRLYTSDVAEFRKLEWYSGSIYSHTVGHAFGDQSNAAHNFFRPSIYRGYSNGGSPDLPSIISRRKEPLLYKNGCTQRIRACEDRLDQDFSLPAGINKTKDDIRVEEVEGELGTRSECTGNSESGEKLVNFSTGQVRENIHAGMRRETAEQNMKCGERSDIMDAEKGSTFSFELEPNESETDNHLPKHTITDRHFKYTFQRKRKRESLLNENGSPENYLPEENVPVENNDMLDENCDLGKISSQISGTLKTCTSDTLTNPENNAF